MADLLPAVPTLHPTTPIHIAVVQPYGRDTQPVMANITLHRAILRQCVHPITGQPVYVHPFPFNVIGDEYARARNELVRVVFTAERDATEAAQKQENERAVAEGRKPGLALPFHFDYMLWVDDDTMVPEDVVEQLLSAQGQIVSGLYFMRKAPYLPVAYTMTNDPNHPDRFWNLTAFPENQVIEVDAVGMGCVLVATEVFRKMSEPWFAWQAMDARPDEHDHRSMGEDMYFATKAKRLGYRVLLNTHTICQHIGEYHYGEELFRSHQLHYYRRPLADRLAICFLVCPAPKPWDGRSIYREPLGGSEASVAYLARSLARLHHTVYVINSTAEIVDIDGVCYRPYGSIQGALQQPWDALVVTRWTDAMTWQMSPAIKTLMFWAHDVYGAAQRDELRKAYGLVAPGQELVGPSLDAFVALTPWHASTCQIPNVTTPILSIPNGLDLSLFRGEEERVPGRLMWTSNPNRGLMSAVRIFRRLRQRWPHFELHIYGRSSVYGWSDAADPMHERPYLPDYDEPGVFLHDPLPKPQLARELMKSWALWYPSTWPETYCIAATESQCFPADTEVSAVGVVGTMGRLYTGELISITTARGTIEVTPEHPFWTDNGWTVASKLDNSHLLLYTGDHEKGAEGLHSGRIVDVISSYDDASSNRGCRVDGENLQLRHVAKVSVGTTEAIFRLHPDEGRSTIGDSASLRGWDHRRGGHDLCPSNEKPQSKALNTNCQHNGGTYDLASRDNSWAVCICGAESGERTPGASLPIPHRGYLLSCSLPGYTPLLDNQERAHAANGGVLHGKDASGAVVPDDRAPEVGNAENKIPKFEAIREVGRRWVRNLPVYNLTTRSSTYTAGGYLVHNCAGTPVISTPYAALPDTVQGGILTYDFEPAFEELMNPASWELLSLRGKEWARRLEWDDVAGLWEKWIKDHIQEQKQG